MFEFFVQVTREQARITHTHPHGIMGSSLQSAAVFTALHTKYGELIPESFLNTLEIICDGIGAEIYRFYWFSPTKSPINVAFIKDLTPK